MNIAIPLNRVRRIGFSGISEANQATIVFGLCMFATGASGYVCEVLLSTVSSYVLGNTIIQFSIVMGLMMIFMGISQWAQVLIGKEGLVEKFIMVELFLSLLCGFTPLIVYGAFAYADTHFEFVQRSLACLIGFLIGFEIPIVLRINEKYAGSLPTNISRTTTWDYIGVAFGLALWIFLLKRGVLITEISFIAGAINLTVALLALMFFNRYKLLKNQKLWVLLTILTSACLVYGYLHNRDWSALMKQRLYEDKIVIDEQTVYQNIVVTHRKIGNSHDYRLFSNGQLQLSSIDEERYHEPLVHPIMALVPGDKKRVMILGGGDGLALAEVLKYKSLESVTLVELDPMMIKLFRDNPILSEMNNHAFSDPRVRILETGAITPGETTPIFQETDKQNSRGDHVVERTAYVRIMNIDADKYIEKVKGKWDVIIIDFPDPGSVELARLYSQEFYLKLKRVLSENGMFVIQATSPYHAKNTFLGINRTIKSAGFNALPYRNNVPSFGDWGWILAWKDRIPVDFVKDRIAEMKFRVETDYLTAKQARLFFDNWGKGELDSEDNWINTHMSSHLVWAYLDDDWKID
jgi:spermidine synthase